MLIRTVVAPLLGTNCYIVVDAAGRCAVVDPGGGVVDQVVALIRDNGWTPVGIVVTHGHVDHTWSAGTLGDLFDVAVHVHADDAYRLEDPFGTLGPLGRQLADLGVSAGTGGPPRHPARLETFTTGPDGTMQLRLAGSPQDPDGGLVLTAVHAPGHTEGSTLYLLESDGPVALTGDVLFAGTIGRTDLPGGDARRMAASLRRVAALPPATAVLPGHGPASRIADELALNPYLRGAR